MTVVATADVKSKAPMLLLCIILVGRVRDIARGRVRRRERRSAADVESMSSRAGQGIRDITRRR